MTTRSPIQGSKFNVQSSTFSLLAALLASLATASAQPHIVSITGPFADPVFGPCVIVTAQQLANKSVTIEAASAPNFSDAHTFAFYDCWPEKQTVVAVVPVGPPRNFAFFRARNAPCNDPLAFLLDPFRLSP